MDIIDAGHGGWGWIALDTVSIPGTLSTGGNTAPTISNIADQSVPSGTASGAIAFTVADAEQSLASLTVTASSSNTTLIPNAALMLGGSGGARTITITPASGQQGTATITVTVSDGTLTASDTFVVTVGPAPYIAKGASWKYLAPLTAATAPAAAWTSIGFADAAWSSGAARIGYGADGEVTAISTTSGKPFTVYFRRTFNVANTAGITGLRLNLSRDDGAVVYLNGTEKWRSNMPAAPATITYDTPASATVAAPNETTYFPMEVPATGLVAGANVIAVEVHQRDAGSSDLGFDLEVVPLATFNNPPTISNIASRTINEDQSTGAIAFTIGDAETPAASLTVTAASNNTALVPAANIVLGGSGANRTVTVTPLAGQNGSAVITVTVNDGTATNSDTFTLTVLPPGGLLIAEDHFLSGGTAAAGQYNPGIMLGQNPVLPGWDGAWAAGAGNLQANATGLRYANLTVSGGKGSTADGTRNGRLLQQPFTSSTTGTYYLSMVLMLDESKPGRYRCLELHNGGFDDASHRVFQIGQHSGNFGHDNWGVRVLNNAAFTADLGPIDAAASLFVLRFDLSASPNGDSISIWRNPASLGGAEPAGGVLLTGFDLAFDRISFASWETPFWETFLALHFDEIRLGTTWAQVTPTGNAAAPLLTYDFEDGTLQGWQTIMSNTDYSPQAFVAGGGGDAQAGARSVKQQLADTWQGFADLAHQTLWIRSPEFRLNGTGDLSFWIFGGGSNALATPPANEPAVPLNSVDTANGGWHGIVLRNAATGAFVMHKHRSGNDTNWQQVTFTAAELAALDQNATYTLDAIDARNNAWSWFNFDSVLVPGTLVTGSTPYDQWADSFGLAGPNRDPAADPDGDGQINAAEFVSGTSPVDSASALKITAVTRSSTTGAITVAWPGFTGISYQLQRSTSLSGWQNIGPVLPGTGSEMTTTDNSPPAGAERVLYRIAVAP